MLPSAGYGAGNNPTPKYSGEAGDEENPDNPDNSGEGTTEPEIEYYYYVISGGEESLPKYDADGYPYVYGVREQMVYGNGDNHYETVYGVVGKDDQVVEGSDQVPYVGERASDDKLIYNGGVVTNRLTDSVSVPVTKTWEAAAYDKWFILQSEVDSYYHENPREKKKLSQEKEFRQIKNAVIQEAERLRGESYACWELRQIIRDDSLPLADRDGAAEKLERLAGWGDPHAQYLMGQLYRDGPLLFPDSQKAKDWLTQAAEQGLPEAQYVLGKFLLFDNPEVRNPKEGIRWLKQAAENGNRFAAYRLGKEYLTGEAMTKDISKTAKWFTRSAEAGNQYAQYMLGKLYLTGQGVTHDQTQAMVWFGRSAAQGNQYAQLFLERQNEIRPPSVMLAATRLLYHMSRIFENHSLPQSGAGLHIDRKRRQQLREKRIALGHKPNDHEEEQSQGMTMKGW